MSQREKEEGGLVGKGERKKEKEREGGKKRKERERVYARGDQRGEGIAVGEAYEVRGEVR